MFQFRKVLRPNGRAGWIASAALHVVLIALAVMIPWRAVSRMTFIQLTPPPAPGLPDLPALGGTEPGRGPTGGLGRPVPVVAAPAPQAAPAPVGKIDSVVAKLPAAAPRVVPAPRLGDARLWPGPRPALPIEVADALYRRDTLPRDSVAVHRLRAMVDTLNQVIDLEQRERRLPNWTTEVTGKKFGLDSSGIYIAGLKIPTPVLAMLGNMLPQGNFDEALRARQLEDMRQDLLQAARRTETLQEFRRYVREIRARKQAERDAERRARGDTTGVRDTVKIVP